MKFKIRDKVMLNSGGPKMTVLEINEKEGIYYCSWFNNENVLVNGTFPEECLTACMTDFPELEPWQYRVLEEKKALDEKIQILKKAVSSPPKFWTERILDQLQRQLSAMNIYSDILKERIDDFKTI